MVDDVHGQGRGPRGTLNGSLAPCSLDSFFFCHLVM